MPWSRVLSFTDPLACQESVQGGHVQFLPTMKGKFQAEIMQVGMNKLWMQRFAFALPQITVVTKSPDRKSIGFLVGTNSSNLQHCGTEVTPSDIFHYGTDLQHQRAASSFDVVSMSLPSTEFPSICRMILGRDLPEEPEASIVRPNSALLSRLLKLQGIVGQFARETPEILELPEVRRALEERLIHVMVRCLADGAGVKATTASRHHAAIIARFEDYLAANPDHPLYLTEICAAVGVAERTLRASCEEHLGMGPIRFLTLRRMHLVHRALLRADPSKTTVTTIVTDYGFWELGRFAVAYRTMFGEVPSVTLRRPAEQVAIRHNRPSSLSISEP